MEKLLMSAALAALVAWPALAAPLATIVRKVDVAAPATWQVNLMHGESKRLELDLHNGREPLAIPAECSAMFYWQTNGMDTAFWSKAASCATNGVCAVDWTGDMDTGADRVAAFLAVLDGQTNRIYAASGALRLQPSPGSAPNELPLPPKAIDFARVVVTNAPWTTEARVAEMIAEIPLPPAPDLSSRVSKSGDTMTGTLNVPRVKLHQGTVTLDLDPIEIKYENGTTYGRNMITLYGQNGSRVEISRNYIELIPPGAQWGDLFSWPSRSGTLALLSDIPDPPAPTPTYAEPAPWSLSLAMLPSAGESSTYVQTNADSDVGEIIQHSATYQDAQLSVVIEDRPPPYSYDAPTGTWSVVSDAAGAASGIDQAGRLSSSRAASGAVTVQYDAGTNGTRMLNVWLSQTARDRPTGRVSEIPGTFRHACQTNLLARFAAVDPDGPRSHYGLQYGGANTDHVELHDILDALSPYNDLGDALAAPTAINSDFFWPELADALRCESVGRSDHPNWWTYAPVLAVSPHFAVTAAHWNFAPTAKFCVSREGSGTFVTCRPAQRWVKPGTDLAVVQYRDAIPTNCIARLCSSNTLARLSPSLFSKAVGVTSSQHNTVHPFVINGGNTQEWLVTGYDAATNAIHYVHGGDSGHVYGIVTPRAQFVPLGCFHTAGGGPALWLDENIDWINARLATLGEAVTEWTYDELIGD